MRQQKIRSQFHSLWRIIIVLSTAILSLLIVLIHASSKLFELSNSEGSQAAANTHKGVSYVDKLIDPVAIFTLFLVVSTVLLWRSTERLAALANRQARDSEESLRIAEISARAAESSAAVAERALMELEAPFLSVVIQDTGLPRRIDRTGHDFRLLAFTFYNHGRSPARLIELVDRVRLMPSIEVLPPPIDLESRTRNTMPWGVLAPASNESQPFTQNLLGEFMGILAKNDLPLQSMNLFFWGFVRYEDIFKNTFRFGFCFVFDRFTERWLLSGESDYNYLVREK